MRERLYRMATVPKGVQMIKTCVQCGEKKPLAKFNNANGWYKNKCRACEGKRDYERKRAKRLAGKTPLTLPKVRHPWELLGIENRPDWSRL